MRVVNLRSLLLGAAGTGALAGLLYLGGVDSLRRISEVNLGYIALAFGATTLGSMISAWRWAVLTDMLFGHKMASIPAYYRSYILSRMASLVMPQTASDLALRPLIHSVATGTTPTAPFASVLIERLLDVAIAVLTLLPATLFVMGFIESSTMWLIYAALLSAWTIGILIVGPTIVRYTAIFIGSGTSILGRYVSRLAPLAEVGHRTQQSLEKASKDKKVLVTVGVGSAVRFVLIALQFSFIAAALDINEIGNTEIFASLPAAQVGTAVAVTPASIGFLEGGFFAYLDGANIDSESIFDFLVGQRLITSGFLLILGVSSIIAGMGARLPLRWFRIHPPK